jgi:hypothetical protein
MITQFDNFLNEGLSKNLHKIEKLVNEINGLISDAYDDDGDPYGITDPSGTWEVETIYDPIEYRNGRLIITSREAHSNKKETEVINKSNMDSDGIPTLQFIRRRYKAEFKKRNLEIKRATQIYNL